ncbi:dTDP-4-dehydrorhamnose 3,5-epimerase family protein [Paenibacillus sp. MMS18-CY102]|uniref:dTDP-4-dehydrorhamnose 3,5-epimerase family protein n=1 Tax=Paenibacillus sp. MMS18-CY102 TaxID=2682849 RepID=UPI001365CC4F|nr:dTDP-4-dehydrorhamnose 3,5-epimerase family protein [Paenibacillus sp. MMS18-CY102]MWC27630.1 spore coat protein [Paenibacillus sp. MMS18-CY102]
MDHMTFENKALYKQKPNHATIQGVKFKELAARTDNRGWLTELLREDSEDYIPFGQLYLVNNYQANVIRAFHMHFEQDEVFFVTNGVIQFILVDERAESPTYKHLNSFVMDASRPMALWVPRGIQHGSMALMNGSQITAVTTQPYNAEKPDELRRPSDYYGQIWGLGGW